MSDKRTTSQALPHDEISRILSRVRRGGASDQYQGKRNKTRFSDGFALEVTLDPAKQRALGVSHLHNISDSGCAFWLRKKLPPRSVVFLREPSDDCEHPWIRGYVTHCTVGIRGFLVGVWFEIG